MPFQNYPEDVPQLRDFAPDMNFFQAILVEPICLKLPEELCGKVKSFFP